MSDNPSLRCAACGRPQEEVRRLITAVDPPLCQDCLRRYQEGLSELLAGESRRRSAISASVAAEELALDLMDQLEASRAGVPQLDEEPPEPAAAPAQEEPPPPAPVEAAPRRKPVAVIPSRYGSTRLPAKPLVPIAGKPMVQHVWERCVESGAFSEVIVATDDERIAGAVRAFGGIAAMTSEHCKSGTDRVAEVALSRPELTHFVNVQGDEPLVHPEMLASLAEAFADPEVRMATLIRPLDEEERPNPSVVKVVVSRGGDALYFSRADIPFARDPASAFPHRYGHVGLYAYTREALLSLSRLPASPLEDTEKLEQLRALECGIPIRCLVTLHRTQAVDTADDVAKVERLMAAGALAS